MTARVLDGNAVARAIREEVAPGVAAFTATAGRPPGLGIVLVGDDPASHVYVRNKIRAGMEAGMFVDLQQLPATATLDDVLGAWAGLGYYSRARNLHACARAVVERHGGRFPPDEAALRTLPGIGAYTAAAITAIAFGRRAVVVDGNVERIITRYHTIDTPPPAARAAIRAAADRLTPRHRPGDFAQAMMDLGATICTPRSPACPRCPLAEGCAGRLSGDPARWPVKARKPAKPERRGLAFVVHDATGRLLARTRAEKGLLGGMTEVPGSAWADAPPPDPETVAPLVARWRSCGGITHVFTHFRLELTVMTAVVPAGTFPPDGMRWLDPDAVAGAALPNVMRKVLARATG